jgi:hypothetical protein
MKRIFLRLIPILIIGLVFHKVYKYFNSLDQTDLEYNTIYTEKYKEERFNSKLLGFTEKDIVNTFGEPFSKTRPGYFNAVLYTNNKDSIFFDEYTDGAFLFTGKRENIKYRFISFDSLGNVKTAMADGYSKNEDQLKQLTKSEIIKKFGKPDKEVLCNCKCEVYSYSKIKEGGFSGKQPTINQRNIVFNNNHIAVKIIKKVGNSYSTSGGTCIEQ